MANSIDTLTKLSAAVSFFFKDDSIRPGVVVSTLQDKVIYASVVRYNNAWAQRKKVVCCVKGATVSEALHSLSKKFVSFTEESDVSTNPLEDLKRSVR